MGARESRRGEEKTQKQKQKQKQTQKKKKTKGEEKVVCVVDCLAVTI